MIIGVIADGLKKPVRRAAKTLDKAAEAFMDKVMAEILRKKEVRWIISENIFLEFELSKLSNFQHK